MSNSIRISSMNSGDLRRFDAAYIDQFGPPGRPGRGDGLVTKKEFYDCVDHFQNSSGPNHKHYASQMLELLPLFSGVTPVPRPTLPRPPRV